MIETVRLRNKSTDRIAVKGWAGEIRDLTKILDHCVALEQSAKNEVRALFEQSEPERKAAYFQGAYYLGDEKLEATWPQQNESELAQKLAGLGVQMSVTQKKWGRELTGLPADVLREMDSDDVVSMVFSIGSFFALRRTEGYAMEVTFDRSDGVEVRAEAPNSLWVESVTASLRSQLVDRRPWYWWMRNFWVAYIVVMVPFYAVISWCLELLKVEKDFAAALVVVFFLIVIATVVIFGLARALKSMIPAFEIVRQGGRAVGARAIAFIGASVLWLIGAVAIPLLLP